VLPQHINSNKQFLEKFSFHNYYICIMSIAWTQSNLLKQDALLHT